MGQEKLETAKIDEKEAYRLISNYYNDRRNQANVLASFLAFLKPEASAQCDLLKARLTPDEMESEVNFALLSLMDEVYNEGHAKGFMKRFVAKVRPALRRYANPKSFVDIEDVSLSDPSPNPEEIYILKEQVQLVKLYLHNNFDLVAVDFFLRRYASGESSDAIAYSYGITRQAVNKRLKTMLPMVEAYMRKMNG